LYLTANIRAKKFKQNIYYKDIRDYRGKKFSLRFLSGQSHKASLAVNIETQLEHARDFSTSLKHTKDALFIHVTARTQREKKKIPSTYEVHPEVEPLTEGQFYQRRLD